MQSLAIPPAWRDVWIAPSPRGKLDRLVRFAERLPDLRKAMAEHMERDWFRIGSERYAKTYRTYGITTLTKRHVSVRVSRIAFRYRGKHRVWVRTALVDEELADAMKELVKLPGGRRLFRYELDGRDLQPGSAAAE